MAYVSDLLYDPTGEKMRARKKSYAGVCKTCGAPTDGSNGKSNAPEYCKKHSNRAHFMIWTESKIIAAIHEWHNIYGRPPIATDWNKQVEGSPGQYCRGPRTTWAGKRRWPPLGTVQARFGSWANAIEAAGFPRPMVGHYRDESKRGEILTKKWTREAIIQWMKDNADGDMPPPVSTPGAPYNSVLRKFGSWGKAQRAAGFEPNKSGRRLVRSTS